MQCLNKLLLSTTPFSLTNAQNSQNKSPIFHPKIRTHKIYHRPIAYRGIDSENASEKPLHLPPNVKTITSTSNPFVKHCVKLRQSPSYRHFHGSVLVVGATPIREIYNFHKKWPDRPIIECLLVLDSYRIPEEIDYPYGRIVSVNSVVMRKLSGVQSIDSVEVIALVRIPSTFHIASDNLLEEDCRKWFSFPHRILVLDGIQVSFYFEMLQFEFGKA